MTELRAKRGDTITIEIAAKEKDGTPQDLSGATLRFMAKNRKTDADGVAVISRATGGAGIVIDDAPLGLATLTIDPASTSGFTRRRTLWWDLQLEAGAVRRTLDDGKLTVLPDVVRA